MYDCSRDIKYQRQPCISILVRTADQEIILEVFLSTNYNIDQALEKLRLPTTDKNYCKLDPDF